MPSRQRLDYVDLPNGDVKAILTVSFPGGVVKRFEAITSKQEAEAVEGDIVAGELMLAGPTVAGWNPFKKVAKLAKKVASSKVFKVAAAGLAIAAPLLGPIAPAALGAAAAMGVASKLAKAGVAAAKGAKQLSAALTASAANDAKRLTQTPEGAAKLLALANTKRLGADRIADGGKNKPAAAAAAPAGRAPASARRSQLPATSPASMSSSELLARARAGRVRSNQPGAASESQLLAAHREGRIYWVS